jgi:hypothetical protein
MAFPVLLPHHASDSSWSSGDPRGRYLGLVVFLPFPFSSKLGKQQLLVIVVGVD